MSRLSPRLALPLALLGALAACSSNPKTEASAPAQAVYTPPPLPHEPTAPWCTQPAEAAAFHVVALKSQLMVAAIQCQGDEKYNHFITSHRSALVHEESVVNEYFHRHSRRGRDNEHDEYITQLANAQADRAQVLGDQFCARIAPLLDEVQNQTDLVSYAAGKTDMIPDAMSYSDCAAQPAAAPAKAKKPAKKK